ncbi:MAG: MBL fold metallo-hydrolase [Candidatus Cloacimonetes bacterium]|nr:MBL fold metallo-hydrolase [Candidatus Cloacimonadota bacterium]
MFQTAVLASGSKGNCILVRTEETELLFDAGLSWRQTQIALQHLTLSHERIKGIVISHEHSDHIQGVGVICRKLKIPVYITELTYSASLRRFERVDSDIIFFRAGDYLEIGDLEVHPFPSSHDAIDACNFTIRKIGDPDRKLGMATDLGFSSQMLLEKLKNSTTLILESNHDMRMLMEGPYTWPLKQRIKSINGHLSNDQAIGVLTQIFHSGLRNIILAHLSEENNHPAIVEDLMNNFINNIKAQTKINVSFQNKPTPLIDV